MSNLKLDIIYYKTSTDFEMEFNLNGCCRMRIFKDKVETPKELVRTLARDVSRSKIVIVVTDLAGYENGMELVSNSIGLPLCPLDNDKFGVQNGDSIFLPKTAVPLINKSGIYGGCILESGPQSIILVSSVRALRHEIMKAYVHNYIFDIAQIEAYNERMGSAVSAETIPSPINEIQNSSSSEKTDKSDDIQAKESLANVDVEETEDAAADETTVETPEETQAYPLEKPYAPDVNTPFVISEEPFSAGVTPEPNIFEDLSSESNYSEKSNSSKSGKKGLNILLLILAVLLLVCIGVLTYFFVYLPLSGAETTFFAQDNFITDFIKEYFMK